MNGTDRLTFWRNWWDACRHLPSDLRLAWQDAVLTYAFDGVEPTPPKDSADVAGAIAFQAVAMVRATIDISRKRREFGSKGGASSKQSESKTKAKRKQNASKAKADRNQEQVQEQEQEHNAISITATVHAKQPSIDQFIAGGMTAGVPESFSRPFYADLVAAGFADKSGLPVGNWRRYLKTAYLDEQKKIGAARAEVRLPTLEDFPIAR